MAEVKSPLPIHMAVLNHMKISKFSKEFSLNEESYGKFNERKTNRGRKEKRLNNAKSKQVPQQINSCSPHI